MLKALRVMAMIAVVTAMVQVCALLIEILGPAEPATEYSATFAQSARLRWMIYWPSGLVSLIIGVFVHKKAALLGHSVAIGGAYLMLLGNNGGLWSAGNEVWRLITSIATLIILGFITLRLDNRRIGTEKSEEVSWNRSPEDNSTLASPGHSQA